MVVIGSAVGALTHSILVELHMLPNAFGGSFIICGMAGMPAASMRTPLLAIGRNGSNHCILNGRIYERIANLR